MKLDIRARKYISFAFMIAIMAMIYSFSAQNAEISGGVSSGLTEKLVAPFTPIPPFTLEERMEIVYFVSGIIRKLAHFFSYAALSVSTVSFIDCYQRGRKTTVSISLLICLLYAISDEVHQLFVGGRSGQVSDVLLDFCGAIVGVLFFYGVRALWRKWKNEKTKGTK